MNSKAFKAQTLKLLVLARKWRSPTKAIRVPEKYADRLIAKAKKWEKENKE
jgi:hypothetical protein